MCGIFAYIGREIDAGSLCFKALKQVEYRGYDSWGIAVCGESLEIKKQLGKLPEYGPKFNSGKMVLGHSRWATHGGVTIGNTHPHAGNKGQALVVHNGIVENYLEIKSFLTESGCTFKSETDTEVVVQLYEYYRTQNDPLTAFLKTNNGLDGNNAIIIMDIEAGMLLATKNGSPMVVGKSLEGSYISSDIAPLVEHCESIYYVENNEVLIADFNNVSVYDRDSANFFIPKWEKPNINLSEVELGSYEHYLIKEVSEQPAVLRQIARSSAENFNLMKDFIRESTDVWFTGCGTAFHAGLLATYYAASVGKSAKAVYAHELPMLMGQMTELAHVIALSQSGETIDVIDAISAIHSKGIKTGALVNVPTSTLARMVDCVLPMQAGPEICVLSTKAFTAMIANLYAVYCPESDLRSVLCSAADAMESMLKVEVIDQIEVIAEKICQRQSLFLIGAGEYYPLALEAALKIKEVSYIHAEAFASGELKHGVIALIEEGTPCLVFAPMDTYGDRIRIHASEIRARGGHIISISPEKLSSQDDLIGVDYQGLDYFYAALTVVQLLAYKCALFKGLDPDKPRNLAKSVTVR